MKHIVTLFAAAALTTASSNAADFFSTETPEHFSISAFVWESTHPTAPSAAKTCRVTTCRDGARDLILEL